MSARPSASALLSWCLAAILVALLGASGMAGEARAQGWGAADLMRELGQRSHARARFVETKYLRLLSQPLTLRGTLSYTPPARLVKHTMTPNEEILTVDGDRVSVEIPFRRIKRSFNLQDNRVLWAFLESLRATLRGDLAALQRFYQTEVTGDAAGWQLTLTPRDAEMAAVIRTIRMSGRKGVLEGIEIQETRGDRSVMRLREETP
jgi:hypothetical protein